MKMMMMMIRSPEKTVGTFSSELTGFPTVFSERGLRPMSTKPKTRLAFHPLPSTELHQLASALPIKRSGTVELRKGVGGGCIVSLHELPTFNPCSYICKSRSSPSYSVARDCLGASTRTSGPWWQDRGPLRSSTVPITSPFAR
jgi:hypothetical protein